MEIIEATYPSYFRAKAESIASRPVFGGHSQSTYTSPSVPSSSSVSSSSYSRVSMETKTLDKLCFALDCRIEDIAEYIKE